MPNVKVPDEAHNFRAIPRCNAPKKEKAVILSCNIFDFVIYYNSQQQTFCRFQLKEDIK